MRFTEVSIPFVMLIALPPAASLLTLTTYKIFVTMHSYTIERAQKFDRKKFDEFDKCLAIPNCQWNCQIVKLSNFCSAINTVIIYIPGR